ncbi:hypothetical protein Hdeb2414_s0021g00576141 [Helianthus debilis subsp. tardiflorus]
MNPRQGLCLVMRSHKLCTINELKIRIRKAYKELEEELGHFFITMIVLRNSHAYQLAMTIRGNYMSNMINHLFVKLTTLLNFSI